MNKGVVGILNRIKADRGEEIFGNQTLLGSLFADYAKGEFKGEFHLMNLAFSTGLYDELKANPENHADIRRRYRIRMDSEYCWTVEQVDFTVACCLALLGVGEQPDDGDGMERLAEAAKQGDAKSQYSLGTRL
jgi:hypothetical protein